MSARLRITALLLICLPSAASVAPAQETGAPPAEGQAVELHATLVEVPTVVSAPGGRYVTDLVESDFTVYEDGVPQEIALFAAVDEPFSVALVLDCSGSARAQLDRIKAAAHAFVDQLRPSDRVAVITFDDEVRVMCGLTNDRTVLRRAVDAIVPGAYTQVYEAVHTVAADVLRGVEGRKAAILFTDGVDTASAIADFDDSLNEIVAGRILVYPIRYATRGDVERRLGLSSASAEPGVRPRRIVAGDERGRAIEQAYTTADEYLAALARDTGGVVHRADTLDELPEALRRIAAELRHQYLLGYYPTDATVDQRSRRITVRVTRPGLTVRARESYRAARPGA
jgi:Ca-activated chloride channel family protein